MNISVTVFYIFAPAKRNNGLHKNIYKDKETWYLKVYIVNGI